jgi:hypothetical protein
VKVSPGATREFPREVGGNHYYLARGTDASPLQLDSDKEKFLFYRGVGGFEPPISARVARDGTVVVTNRNGEAIDDVILFDNRGGAITYRVRSVAGSQIALDPPVADGESATPQAELERILIAHGLFPKEAKAMVETWRDSWFEEGLRVFYLLPHGTTDRVLPLEIERARLVAKIEAPFRGITIAGKVNDDWVELHTVRSPLEPFRVEITEKRQLRLDASGGLHLQLSISDSSQKEAGGLEPGSERWRIEYIELEVSGRTQ